MMRHDDWQEFTAEWRAYLDNRGHDVGTTGGVAGVLTSRDRAGKRYRWLLLVARGKTRALTPEEAEDVRYHLGRGMDRKQETYVVIRFEKPQPKVVVLRADKALEQKRILARKGGVPWGD